MQSKKTVTTDRFDGVLALINEKFVDISEKLDRIEKQTMKTNGTVADLCEWRSTSKGALGVISAVVVPLLLYLVYLHIPR